LNGLNDRARSSNRIFRFFGLGELFTCKFNFENSLESRGVIVLARADGAGNFAMRPCKRRESCKQDLFRSRLDQIIDMNHALGETGAGDRLAFSGREFGAVYRDKPGQPPLPTRQAKLFELAPEPGGRRSCLKADPYRAGAFDVTNAAIASGSESTTPSRTTDPTWFTTQIDVCFNDTSSPT
jgi:hypothetical protein